MSMEIGSATSATEWTLLETLSPSSVATISTGALSAYDAYRVSLLLTNDNVGATAFGMRLNTDAAANYNGYIFSAAPAVAASSAQTSALIAEVINHVKLFAEVFIVGKSAAAAGAACGIVVNTNGIFGAVNGIRWAWTAGNAIQVTSMTFLPTAGNITGKILVYGRNIA